MKFTEFNLSPALQNRLNAGGFETPTPVQEATIPNGLAGKDIVATAQTGTGKTLAFLLPTIQLLSTEPRQPGVRALIRDPTMDVEAARELVATRLAAELGLDPTALT